MAIWTINPDINKAEQELNGKINKINEWARKLNLIFSPEKSKIVPITRKRLIYDNIKIFLKTEKLEIKSSHKYLGITIDAKMNWRTHIEDIEARANKKAEY